MPPPFRLRQALASDGGRSTVCLTVGLDVFGPGVVREKKVSRCYIGYFMRCRNEFSDTNEKTNIMARLKTARRIY